jgi:hypothetical protein
MTKKRDHFKVPQLDRLLLYPQNVKSAKNKFVKEKHSSLFLRTISDKSYIFYKFDSIIFVSKVYS